MNAIQVFGHIGFASAVIGGFACWFIALVNMIRTVRHRKPGVPLFPSWYESPFNILFSPSQLTNRGLTARRWCFYGVIGFLICWMLAMVIGLITGVTI